MVPETERRCLRPPSAAKSAASLPALSAKSPPASPVSTADCDLSLLPIRMCSAALPALSRPSPPSLRTNRIAYRPGGPHCTDCAHICLSKSPSAMAPATCLHSFACCVCVDPSLLLSQPVLSDVAGRQRRGLQRHAGPPSVSSHGNRRYRSNQHTPHLLDGQHCILMLHHATT